MNAQKVTGEWLYLFPEGEMWIVACKFYDVVAQGKTKEEALERFFRTFSVEILWRAEDASKGEQTDLLPPPPPPEVLASWQKRHAEHHYRANAAGGAA